MSQPRKNPPPFRPRLLPQAQAEAMARGTLKELLGELAQAAAEAAAEEKARKEAEEAALRNAKVGQLIPGHGVYAGQWTLTVPGRKGFLGFFKEEGLTRTFNVFAAPEDLADAQGQRQTVTFNGAVEKVAGLKGWHGHDGETYDAPEKLFKALKEGTYGGGWFIPTIEILQGNLYGNKDAGTLKGTWSQSNPPYYLSCTVEDRILQVDCFFDQITPSLSLNKSFEILWEIKWLAEEITGRDPRNILPANIRPVRLEPVTP